MKSIIIALSLTGTSAIFANVEPVTTPPAADLQEAHEGASFLGDQTTTCFNITGTWKGVCDDKALEVQADQQPTQYPTEMTFIQKGCSSIQAIEFGPSYVGAIKTESVSSPRGVQTKSGTSNWIQNGTALEMWQSFNLVKYGEQGSTSFGKVKGLFTLDGNTLVGKIEHNVTQMTLTGKLVSKFNKESNCRLIRQ
jgi:hypothetical protein